jgi:hypothetical protein
MLETVNKVIDNNRRALLSPEKSDLNHLNLLVKEKINSDRWLARSRREVRKVPVSLYSFKDSSGRWKLSPKCTTWTTKFLE